VNKKSLSRITGLFSLLTIASTLAVKASAGDLDTSFGSGGLATVQFGTSNMGNAVAIQSDGKILLAGSVRTTSSATEDVIVLRFNTDGSLDATFGSGGHVTTDFNGADDSANAIAVQADGKIVVAGASSNVTPGPTSFGLVRYHANGNLDTSFGSAGKVTTTLLGGSELYAIAIQSDGKIVVAGMAGDSFAVARYNSDGSFDNSFGSGGIATILGDSGFPAFASSLVLQPDGKIVVGGGDVIIAHFLTGNFVLVRSNVDGTLDTAFGNGGIVETPFFGFGRGTISALALQIDGKILAAGDAKPPESNNESFALARYNTDGALDTSFGDNGIVITDFNPATDEARGVAVQSDGKIIAAGFAGPSGNLDFALARYNSDGTLDANFGSGGQVTTAVSNSDDSINAIALQPDGKVLAAGSSGLNGGSFAIARYLTAGAAPQLTRLSNISTRVNVLTADNIAVAGFILQGSGLKRLLIRGLGPTLALDPFRVTNVLADPLLVLHTTNAQGNDQVVATNDSWKINTQTGGSQQTEVEATGRPPSNDLEAALMVALNPGTYTAILSGNNSVTGNALVDLYDVADPASASFLTNISARGFVGTGDQVLIGGFIIGPQGAASPAVLARALGPSLASFGITNALANPTLELHDANGTLITSNDNWKSTQQAEISATGKAPPNDLESAIARTLAPGSYTAIVRGINNTTGVALVEVYDLQ
jgi:uncharacterized delta-60 repeat protein